MVGGPALVEPRCDLVLGEAVEAEDLDGDEIDDPGGRQLLELLLAADDGEDFGVQLAEDLGEHLGLLVLEVVSEERLGDGVGERGRAKVHLGELRKGRVH